MILLQLSNCHLYLLVDKRYWLIGLSYKQKCNNFGYLLIQVWLKGNDIEYKTEN